MITIKALNGDKLRLTTTRLTEIDHDTSYAYHVTKKNLQRALKLGLITVKVHGKNMYGKKKTVGVSFYTQGEPNIGCKNFSLHTFDKILNTMGLKRN